MKKANKLWLALLLAVLVASLLAVGLTAVAGSSTVIESGSCGTWGNEDSVTWTLTEDGTLTVRGTGVMETRPWKSGDLSRIKRVVVEQGVTRVKWGAFQNCTELISARLADSVTEIEDYAFDGCAKLTDIIIPKRVTYIGEDAFSRCTSLTYFIFPESEADILQLMFFGCSSLKTIVIPGDIEYIASGAFDECYALTDVYCCGSEEEWNQHNYSACFPAECDITVHYNLVDCGYCGSGKGPNVWWTITKDGKVTIGGSGEMYVGWDPDDNNNDSTPFLQNDGYVVFVEVQDGVTTIGNNMFANCNYLKQITLPETLTTIGPNAFRYCSGLKSVSIPSGVTTIEHDAFNCLNLRDVFYSGSKAQWDQMTIREGNENLLNANIHYNVVDWGYCGGEGDGTNLIWALDNDGTLTISGTGRMNGYYYGHRMEDGFYSTAPWWNYHDSIQTLKLEEGLTFIGVAAFRGCSSIKAVVLPVSLTRVQEWVFSECDAITDVFYGGDNIQWYGISYFDPGLNKDESLVNGVYGVGSLPRAHIHYNATWHTPGETVIENEVAATCTTAGGYDEVVYCTVCPCELSRNHVTVDPLDHPNRQEKPKVLPRKGHHEHGHEAGVWCPDCNRFISGGETIHNQDGEPNVIKPATLTETGEAEIMCTFPGCEEWGLYELPMLDPEDVPDEPENPDQPDTPNPPDEPDDDSFGARFIQRVKGFIETLLRLIRWLGRKK